MARPSTLIAAAGAAMTLNALRPAGADNPLAVPSFFGAWLTAELATHNLACTAAGGAARIARHGIHSRQDKVALALDAISMAGLASIVAESRRAGSIVEDALVAALGPEYADQLTPTADHGVSWRSYARPFRFGHPDVETISDIQYTGAGSRHRLDLVCPREPGKDRPVLIQLHGGAWMIGEKSQQGQPLMHHMASLGWVCVAPNYRLAPKNPWPAQLVDVKRTIAWVRREIQAYGGDPSFIAITGGSAGGHLAAMAALTPDDPNYQPGFEDLDTSVQACVPFYGVYDLADSLNTRAGRLRRDRFLARMVFKTSYRNDPALFDSASPLLLAHGQTPPFLVVHGVHDSLAPVAEARELVSRLRAGSAAPIAYAELPRTQHAFDVFHSPRSAHVIRGAERFLRHIYWRSHRKIATT